MLSGSPIQNKGYYDVPICNEYSNKEIRDKRVNTNEYELNKLINVNINNNKNNYVVYQDPTIPSPSLYLESDQSMSGYYHKNPMTLAFDGSVPINKKSKSKVYNYINSDAFPPFGYESFDNNNKTKTNGNFIMLLIIITFALIFFYK